MGRGRTARAGLLSASDKPGCVSGGVTADTGLPGGTQVEAVWSVAENVIGINLQLIKGSALTQAMLSAKKAMSIRPTLSLTSPSKPAIDMTGTSSPADDALLLMLRLGSCSNKRINKQSKVSEAERQVQKQ